MGESEGEENACIETVYGSNVGIMEDKIVLAEGESGSVVEGTIVVSMVTNCGGCVTPVCSCVSKLEGSKLSMVEECITCTVLKRSDVCLNASLEVKSSSCGLSGLLVTVGSKTVWVCELMKVACGLLVTVGSKTVWVCELMKVGCGLLVSVGSKTVLVCELGCGLSVARRLLVTVGSSTR